MKKTSAYKEAFLKVRAIVNEADPMGLAGICPEDEYDPEVGDLLAGMRECGTKEELSQMARTVFEKWFGEIGNPEVYDELGAGLWEVKQGL